MDQIARSRSESFSRGPTIPVSARRQARRILDLGGSGRSRQSPSGPADQGLRRHQRLSALLTLMGHPTRLTPGAATGSCRRRTPCACGHASRRGGGSWNWDNLANWDAGENCRNGASTARRSRNWQRDVGRLATWGQSEEAMNGAQTPSRRLTGRRNSTRNGRSGPGDLWRIREHRLVDGNAGTKNKIWNW